MRSKDVIYISNAVIVEASKAINFFRNVVGSVNDPLTAANSLYTLKSAIAGTGGATTLITAAPIP